KPREKREGATPIQQPAGASLSSRKSSMLPITVPLMIILQDRIASAYPQRGRHPVKRPYILRQWSVVSPFRVAQRMRCIGRRRTDTSGGQHRLPTPNMSVDEFEFAAAK